MEALYRAIVVDDEYIVRMDIKRLLDWESLGIEFVDDAIDGRDAMKKINEWNPIIVFLDIGMPGMNGIEVLGELKSMDFPGKVIVLSCHDDFAYVKQALLLGAEDYLLKHDLEPKALEKTVSRIKHAIEAEETENRKIQQWRELALETIHSRRGRFIRQLLQNTAVDLAQAERTAIELELAFSLRHVVVIAVKLCRRHAEKDKIIANINAEVLSPEVGYCVDGGDTDLHIIVGFSSQPSFLHIQNQIFILSGKVVTLLNQRFHVQAFVGVSDIGSQETNMGCYLNQAIQAQNLGFYYGTNRVIHYSEATSFHQTPPYSFKEYEIRLAKSLVDTNSAKNEIAEIYKEWFRSKVAVEGVRDMQLEFVSFVNKTLRDHNIEPSEVFEPRLSPYEQVGKLQTYHEAISYLGGILEKLSILIQARSKIEGMRKEIADSIDYLKRNYHRELSLGALASRFHMNSNYFSNVFKKETGDTFVGYLQNIRIDQAKALLRQTDVKVFDIAAQVGIHNYHYFCKAFKKITGMTPIQYRLMTRGFSPE